MATSQRSSLSFIHFWHKGWAVDQLQAMRVFVRVAERASFSAVARELDMTQSQVSRHVAKLEESLGAHLLTRSTRHVTLTQEGQLYLESVRRALSELDEGEAMLHAGRRTLTGRLRIATALPLFQFLVFKPLRSLMARHPGLELELQLSVGTVDLVANGIDMAIRAGALADSGLMARKLCDLPYIVVASRQYLVQTADSRPPIVTPESLSHHECLWPDQYRSHDWSFEDAVGRSIRVNLGGRWRIDEGVALREALIHGLGVALLPRYMVADLLESGEYIELLSAYRTRSVPLYAVYPASRRQVARVEAVIQALLHDLQPHER